MKLEDVIKAQWGCLKSDPDMIFKITFVNSNNTIEYHIPNNKERHEAPFSEICLLEEKDVPDEIKNAFIQFEDEENESGFLEMN